MACNVEALGIVKTLIEAQGKLCDDGNCSAYLETFETPEYVLMYHMMREDPGFEGCKAEINTIIMANLRPCYPSTAEGKDFQDCAGQAQSKATELILSGAYDQIPSQYARFVPPPAADAVSPSQALANAAAGVSSGSPQADTPITDDFKDFLDDAKSAGKITFPDGKYLSIAACQAGDDKCLPMSQEWVQQGLTRLGIAQARNRESFYRSYQEQGITRQVVNLALAALAIEGEHSGSTPPPDSQLPPVSTGGLAGISKVEGGFVLPSNHPLNSPLFRNNAGICDPNIIRKAKQALHSFQGIADLTQVYIPGGENRTYCSQLPLVQAFVLRLEADLEGKRLSLIGKKLSTSQGQNDRLPRAAIQERNVCERLRDDLKELEAKFLKQCTVAVDDQGRLTAGPREGVTATTADDVSSMTPAERDVVFASAVEEYFGRLNPKLTMYLEKTAKSGTECDLAALKAFVVAKVPQVQSASKEYVNGRLMNYKTAAELKQGYIDAFKRELFSMAFVPILNDASLKPCYPCEPEWNMDLPSNTHELCNAPTQVNSSIHIGQAISIGSIIRFQGHAKITQAALDQLGETIEQKRRFACSRVGERLTVQFGLKGDSIAYKAASKAIVRESSECLESLIGMKVTSEERVGRLLDECIDGSAEIALSRVSKEKP